MFEFYLQQFINNFHFLRPWWVLLLLPFLLLWLGQVRRHQKSQLWQSAIAPHLLKVLKISGNAGNVFSPIGLLGVLIVIFVIVLMGPTWEQEPSPFEKDAAALYIALDVSSSMESRDVQPSRIERAKQKITDLLELRQSGKTALLVYAGSAHSVLPLATDTKILENYLRAISTNIMPRSGKFAERILPLIDQDISERNPVEHRGAVTVLLITDGIASETLTEFQQYFSKHDYNLLVLGIGLNPSELAVQDMGKVPPLDVNGLERLASNSGGQYIALTLDDSDVKEINARVRSYRVTADEDTAPWLDAGYYLIFVAMLLLLPWFRKGWAIQWSFGSAWVSAWIGATMIMSMPQPAHADVIDWWLTPDQQGQWYFERGAYKKAAEKYEDITWKATAYYLAEEFELAAEYFSRIDTEAALFKRANALAHSRNYKPAVRVYDELLKLQADYPGAVHNRDIVQDIIDQINLMSQSQAEENGDSSQLKEFGEVPETADGDAREYFGDTEIVQYSSEEILQNESLNEKWMRSVEPNPSRFLEAKFYIQLEGDSSSAAVLP